MRRSHFHELIAVLCMGLVILYDVARLNPHCGCNFGSYGYTYSYTSNGSFARTQTGIAVIPTSTGTPYSYNYAHTDKWGESISLGEIASVSPNGGTVQFYQSTQSTTDALTDEVGYTTASSNTSTSLQANGSLWTQQSGWQVNSSLYGYTNGSGSSVNTYTAALPSAQPPSPYLLMPTALSNSPAPAGLDLGASRVVPSLFAIGQELPSGTLPGLGTRAPLPSPAPMYVPGPVLTFTPVPAYGNWLGQQYGNNSPNWIGMAPGVSQMLSPSGMGVGVILGSFAVPTPPTANPMTFYAATTKPTGVPQARTQPYTDITQSQAQSTAELGLRMFSQDGEGIYGTVARETGLSYVAELYVANSAEGARIAHEYQADGYRPNLNNLAPAFANAAADGVLSLYQTAAYAYLAVAGVAGGGFAMAGLGAAGSAAAGMVGVSVTAVGGTTGGAIIGFGVGYVYGGMTGSGSWDWDKAVAGGISGALLGAGIGLSLSTGGGGFLGSVAVGALTTAGTQGFSTFQSGTTVNWSNWGTATGVGLVSGAVAGAVGYTMSAFTTAIGQQMGLCGMSALPQMAAKFALGFANGAVTDAAFQGVNMLYGQQDEFSIGQMIAAGATSGVLNVMLGNACYRGRSLLICDPFGGMKRLDEFKKYDPILVGNEFDPSEPPRMSWVDEVMVRWGRIVEINVGGRIIGTTPEHPHYVINKRRFVPAIALELGDVFRSHDGQWVRCEGVVDTGRYEQVYNLRVAGGHTYFVGGEDWGFTVWAHNACSSTSGETKAAANGRAKHKQFSDKMAEKGNLGETTLGNGKRVDGIKLNKDGSGGIVYELKPRNPRAIARGETQLAGYVPQVEAEFGGTFRGIVITY